MEAPLLGHRVVSVQWRGVLDVIVDHHFHGHELLNDDPIILSIEYNVRLSLLLYYIKID